MKLAKRSLLVLALASLVTYGIISQPQNIDKAKAGAISAGTLSPTSVAASAIYAPTITFTTTTTIPAGGTINLTFLSLSPAQSAADRFNASSASLTSSSPAGLTLISASGDSLTLQTAASLSAQAFSIVLGGIIAPANCSLQVVNITTRDNVGNLLDGNTGGSSFPTSITNTVLVGTAAIRGTLTKSDGTTPVANAYVSLNDSNYRYITGSQTQSDGVYAICPSGVSTGSYSLMIFLEGSVANNYSDQVAPDSINITYSGSTVTQNLSLAAATKTISGTVTFQGGGRVNGGVIEIFGMDSPSWRQININASGAYSAKVSGGRYGLNPRGASASPAWAYTGEFQEVSFNKNQASESQTVNFTVSQANARISITVLDPNGTKVDGRTLRGSIGLMPANFKGGGAGANLNIDENGKAESNMPAGKYRVELWMDPTDSRNWYVPTTNITLTNNTTTSMAIQLKVKSGRIVGKVTDVDSGGAIANVFVGSFSEEAGGFSAAQSGGDGNFSIAVIEGYEWGVMAMPEGGFGKESQLSQSYVQVGGPQFVTVAAGKPAPTANLKMKKADSSAKVAAVGEDGKVVTSFYGYASFNNDDGLGDDMFSGIGGPIDRGVGTISLPSGSYQEVQLFAAPGAGVIPGNPLKNVTIPNNTANYAVNYPVYNPDSYVDIILKKTDGSVVKDVYFMGCAFNKNGVWLGGEYDSANGRSRVQLSSKFSWTACAEISDDNYVIQINNPTITLVNGRATVDATLREANAIITGTVYGADGRPLSGAYVTAFNRGGNLSLSGNKKFLQRGALTDSNGSYQIKVAADTYNITAMMPASAGLINPAPQQVNVGANSTTAVHLTFRAPNHTISGTVKNDLGATVASALVNAYSAEGEIAEATTDATGVYRLRVLKDKTWTVEVNKDDDNDVLSAGPTTHYTLGDSSSLDFTLSRSSDRLGNSVTKNSSATSAIAASTANASITFPASSTGSSGTTTITSTETSEAPSDRDNQVVGAAVDINASNNGSDVTELNSSATLRIDYRDSDITTGISESDLSLAYYDETAGAWVNVGGTVDTSNNTIVATVDHLTKFAIVASVDTIAPAAPTNLTATDAGTSGKVILRWTNPTDSDFDHIVVYQSTASGTLGSQVASTQNAATTSLTVSNLTDGRIYHFTIKAADSVGNLSVASDQVSQTPSSSGAPLPQTGRALSSTWSWLSLFSLIGLVAARLKYVYQKSK